MALVWWQSRRYSEFNQAHSMSQLDNIVNQYEADKLVSFGPYNKVIYYHHDDKSYYIKRYHKAGNHLRRYLGRSRVRGEWENLIYFMRMGIPIPAIVAYGEKRTGGLFNKGYLITEEVENAKDLASLSKEQSSRLKDYVWVNKVIDKAAQYTKKLHQEGFVHNDLKWRNILVTLDDEPELFFFDCPIGQHKYHWRYRRGVIKDLANLDRLAAKYLSRAARLRFYMKYQAINQLDDKHKKILRKVQAYFTGQ